jgi:hypothetical protein
VLLILKIEKGIVRAKLAIYALTPKMKTMKQDKNGP